MSPAPLIVSVVALLVSAVPARPPEVRREAKLEFAIDPAVQERGSVQYFFAVGHKEANALQKEPFKKLMALLPPPTEGTWTNLHAMASRFAYTVEKDVSFFTRERAVDPAYMNTLIPDGKIRKTGERTFRSELLPASSFQVRYLTEKELLAAPEGDAIQAFLAFAPELGTPASVMVQHNYDFERVMGVRTAAISVTWSAQYRIAEGRTRVVTYALTLLHNVPPFFLGGDQRLHDSLMEPTLKLIERMRSYKD